MYGEYGYMEEGPLGRPYDLRLLKRIAGYARPYRKTVSCALFLTLLLTLLDLMIPYLTKVAIDRYILVSWYEIRIPAMDPSALSRIEGELGPVLVKERQGNSAFVSNVDLKKIDPALLTDLRKRGIVADTQFYRVPAGLPESSDLPRLQSDARHLEDGSLAIPMDTLKGLHEKEILLLRADDIRGLAFVALFLLCVLLVSFWLGYGEYYLLEFIGQRIMQDIRLQLFHRIGSQAVSFFDRHPVGRLVTRVTNDTENLNEMFKSVMVTVFKDAFLLAGILFVLLYLNWKLALVCFTLLPFIFILTLLFSSMAREAFRELRATVAKINAFLQERIPGMKTIQLFATEDFQKETFSGINHENYLAGMKQILIFGVFVPVMELFSAFALSLLIWYGGGKVIGEHLTLGSLVAFIGYIQMFFKPIRDISEKYNVMQSAMASTERIFEFMDHKEKIPEPDSPVAPSDGKGHLRFNRVSFSYRRDQPVLKDVSFEVRPGEMVAIVGATGAGKTTVVNLIERFYDPAEGNILLDGVDIREWASEALRSHVSLVMQDVFIFSGSVSDNIRLGEDRHDQERMEEAIRLSNAVSFIERLPKGLSQELGEAGSNLSSGERQLLSFARALARRPKLLVLDEATSSVDPETERLIQEAIFRMAEKRTTLVVAHRLSTIRRADHILVMHHGAIREQGNHEELMALRGIYYRLNKVRDA